MEGTPMTKHEDTTSIGWENEPSIAPGSRPRDPKSTGANRKPTGKTDRAAPDETKPDAAETPTGALKSYEPVDLWGSFDPPELPKDLLPPIIEEFAFTEGANMGCDPAGLAMSALAVCAAAIPDGVQLLIKMNSDGWRESARIWVALVAPPSGKKTPIINKAAWPLKKIDEQLYIQFLADIQAYNRLPADEQEQREKPKEVRLRLEDTTIEAAQDVFANSPNGLLGLQDEISGWFGSMDKYSGGGNKDRAFWLQAYNGGSYFVHRVKRGTTYIENLSACLLGGVQPDKIREVAADGVDDGLVQRLNPIILRPATADRDEVRDEINVKYGKLIEELHNICPVMAPLKFSSGAQAIRREMADKHLALESCEAFSKKFQAHIGKYNGMFGRFCVIFHCIETVGQDFPTAVAPIVSEDTARRVGDFMHNFLMQHALSFYNDVLGLSDEHESLIKVAGFILTKKLKKIDRRTVQMGVRTMRKMKRKDIEDVFDQLDAFGWITKSMDKNRNIHGAVNPRVHELFEEKAKAETIKMEAARKAMAIAFEQRAKQKRAK
jgi:hypothetical protein